MVKNKTKKTPRLHLAPCVKHPTVVQCYLLVISLFTTAVVAEEILVITHQDTPVSNLSTKQVANLYLGVGENKHNLTPFDLHDKKLRQNFYGEVTGLSLASIRTKRAKQVFTGRGRPPAMLTLETDKSGA